MTRIPSAMLLLLLSAAVTGCSGGSSCTVVNNDDGSATINCEDGTNATVRGGMDGSSCTVADDGMGGRVISCDDGTTVTVRDGMDGNPGDPGDPGDPGTPGRGPWVAGGGLLMEVTAQGVDADRHPYVEVTFTDQDGHGLDRDGVLTEGAISASFTAAYLSTEDRSGTTVVLPFTSYISRPATSADGSTTVDQATSESDGTWTVVDVMAGQYRYVFSTTLPADYATDATTRIGIYATREFEGVRYVANATPTFRPDGMDVTVTRDVVTNAACNQCHNPISAHGGSRESVDLCVTCHNPGSTDPDTGNTVDMETMIHRIHRGAGLPSVAGGVPYQIIGYRGSVHDYSDVVFPREINSCETCHQGPDGDNYLTEPSRASCGGCHDDIWFEAGAPPEPWMTLHPGGDRPDDTRCTICHEATGGLSPIADAHFTALQQPDALAIHVTIDGVTTPASGPPVVSFTVMVNGAPYDIMATPFDRFSLNVAGPSTDFQFNQSFTVSASGLAAGTGAGHFTYTLPMTIGAIATANGVPVAGTWGFAFEGRTASPSGINYPVENATRYVSVSGGTAVPRRQIVSVANCNTCHEQLEAHGGNRSDPNYCVFCHNPNADGAARMPLPAPGDTAITPTIDFSYLIHRLHTGEAGDTPYVVYGYGGRAVDLGETRFPADRRDCLHCHVNESTYDLPLPSTNLPSHTRELDSAGATVRDIYLPPTTTACVGCHANDAALAHAETMTTAMGVEGCAACHASGSAFGVDVVHARPEYDIRTP